MKLKPIIATLSCALLIQAASAQTKLKTGVWRGALSTKSGNEIPFNFDVKDTAGKQQLAIINGVERFKVTDVATVGDSVFIHMPLFNSEFKLKLDGDKLTGNWIKHLASQDVLTPFAATPNTTWRFLKAPEKPAFNIGGRWSAIIGEGDGADTTVGEFKQVGSKLTGTFLTTTGDYRYLEGIVAGDKLFLSCFDGGHAYTFTATIKDDKTLTGGKFYAGYSGLQSWAAVKDANAKLPDAYSLTALKPGFKKIDFTFKDIEGKTVSLQDNRYKNKVVIVQILGSWCPNCMDETAYMVNYYKKYQPKGVEVVGLAYERSSDFAKSQKALQQVKTRFNVPYELLITGYTSDKAETSKSLPMLSKVVGFPTTIIIDKSGDVRKIHTGFSGPGTGEYYKEFINEFEKLTDDLLAEAPQAAKGSF
ncbi:peroxiredoxin family protein [Mucilaginibacter ginsenosidivorax]|uniref:TlpA family protein disulfide reductase n=1 Tax=Mucilaginibacter ginsenosidivorax TaxID=862126 RepID=A0A5B8W1B6_9SPHI|nr:TlpA disulfide reductase family protein [Mucilaginibacter ginsenosidivorax]QEC77481.1 TlpA family protein disulfide reductase [Mucilaginibacter ginsenosidivorax]